MAGRLKPGIACEQAQAQLNVVAQQFRKQYPDAMGPNEGIRITPLRESIVGDVRRPLLILSGAVVFVLLISCANVANLLLARAAGRNREIAVRTALGARRVRLVRQLLTESVLLACLGGAVGLLIGAWGLRLLLAVSPGDIPRMDELTSASWMPDGQVLGFTLLVSLLTGVIFGLAPALQASKPDLNQSLKEGTSPFSPGLRRHRMRGLLVSVEIALALVLLIGAGLLIRTFMSLHSVRPGFDPRNVLTMKMSLAGSKYGTTAAVENFTVQVLRRIEALPGVQFASSATNVPLDLGPDLPFVVEGRPESSPNGSGDAQWRAIGPHYFQTMGIPLLRGRYFTEGDTGKVSGVVIINDVLARQFWPGEDPIGRRITIGKGIGPGFEEPPRQIVGIVGDVKEISLDAPAPITMFVPFGQVPDGMTLLANQVIPTSWVIRTAADPFSLSKAIQREILAVDGYCAAGLLLPRPARNQGRSDRCPPLRVRRIARIRLSFPRAPIRLYS